jgi:hypothetical protein
MFFSKAKKEALKVHERAADKYNETYVKMQSEGENLYRIRQKSLDLIEKVESLINSIANSPKDFEVKLDSIREERLKFRKTEEYAREAYDNAVKSGVSMAAGIAGGAAVASMAPSVAMWVATTFGTASTGTAISALHGAVATKAALAWLGGGALTAGGGGIAAGKALLALAGPIGWSIAGVATGASALFITSKNKATAQEAMDQAKEITKAGAYLNETCAKIQALSEETSQIYYPLSSFHAEMGKFVGADYTMLDNEQKKKLGTLVNNALTLTALVNKKIEADE